MYGPIILDYKKPISQTIEKSNIDRQNAESNLKNLSIGALCGADLVSRLTDARDESNSVVDEQCQHLVDLLLHLWCERRGRRVARHLEVRLACQKSRPEQ